jgi:uncharacterized protein (TIGR02996 family)
MLVPDLRTALEDALQADPDDRAAHSAYADLLTEQGDPRGEFVSVQLALEDEGLPAPRHAELKDRERALLETHQRAWLGPLAALMLDDKPSQHQQLHGWLNHVVWSRGWVEKAYIWWFDLKAGRALARCPAARLLRRLDLHHVYSYQADDFRGEKPQPEDGVPPDAEDFTALYTLVAAPFVPHLRWLRVGEAVNFDEGPYNNEAFAQGLVELVGRTRRLEELHVLAHGLDMDRLFALPNLEHLRTLIVYHGHEIYPLSALADNPSLRRLEVLRLHPAFCDDADSYLPLDEVAPLLHSPHLTSLRELHLQASDMGDLGCEEIVESGILKRLEVLDLRHGCVTDDGARILAACPVVRKLKLLSLEHNQLTDAGRGVLHGLGIPVRDEDQAEAGSTDFLFSGDVE